MNALLTCIEDATLSPQLHRPHSSGLVGSTQHQNLNQHYHHEQQYGREDIIEKFICEGKELRKKIKQMSNKIFQIESERCAERIEFQKQIEAQNNSYSAEMFQMNSHRLVEISRMLSCIQYLRLICALYLHLSYPLYILLLQN